MLVSEFYLRIFIKWYQIWLIVLRVKKDTYERDSSGILFYFFTYLQIRIVWIILLRVTQIQVYDRVWLTKVMYF